MGIQRESKFKELTIIFHPKVLKAWWTRWHTMPVGHWLLGAYYFHRKDFVRAANYYQTGLMQHASHPAALLARLDYAYCLLKVGEWQQAEQELFMLTCRSKAPEEVYLILSRLQLNIGNADAAIRVLKRYIEQSSANIKVKLCLFEAFIVKGQLTHDLKDLRKDLINIKAELDLEDELRPFIDTALASYEYIFGDKALAEQMIARVIATGSFPVEALVLRAKMLLETGRSSQALLTLERALKIKPDYLFAYQILSQAYLMTTDDRQVESALQAADFACRLTYWQNPACMKQLADCYEVQGDSLAALLMAERALAQAKKLYQLPIMLQTYEQHVGRLMGQIPTPDSLPSARQ